jgi:hypothetical protein
MASLTQLVNFPILSVLVLRKINAAYDVAKRWVRTVAT